VTLLRGMLLSFDDPLLGLIPTAIIFQYNPTEVTRVLRSDGGTGAGGSGASGSGAAATPGSALSAPRAAIEEYTLKLEFDATDGLEKTAPITMGFGISPRLAALEMLMQPVGTSLLGGLAGSLLGGGGGAAIPASRVPLVFFAWGPTRITPVRLSSLTIHETAFDDLLNPIHANADIGLTVLRKEDLAKDDTIARAAADFYKGAREVKAVLALPQTIELA
jgi:hypothetical protein